MPPKTASKGGKKAASKAKATRTRDKKRKRKRRELRNIPEKLLLLLKGPSLTPVLEDS